MSKIVSSQAQDLIDRDYLRSLESSIGSMAMRKLVAAFLRDCQAARTRMEQIGPAAGIGPLSKEAHKIGGMLAQFGCPVAAAAFKQASTASLPEEMAALVDRGYRLLDPTCAAMRDLYGSEMSAEIDVT